MPTRRFVPDAVGLLVLAALAGLVAWFVAWVYGSQSGIWTWGIGYPVVAIVALFVWQSETWPTDPLDLMRYALFSIPIGATSFAIDAASTTSAHPELPFREAIWQAWGPFGIVLTICICPGFTSIALAGTVRAVLISARDASSRS